MAREWTCTCKDCDKPFSYSDSKYQAGRARGFSRPERCDDCRAQHAREIQSLGQAYFKVRALKPIGDPRRLTSDLGRFNREDRPHQPEDIRPAPIDPDKFGIKDDRIVEMLHFFRQDPGLQVVVVVGPTGSGKSTYFPYRLAVPPLSYLGPSGAPLDRYWTVPIESDEDLAAARAASPHAAPSKGHDRFYAQRPDDPRAREHAVAGPEGFDPAMFRRFGQIVVTQPRIQATRNIPEFIAAAMMGCRLGAGHDVGFRHSGAPNSDWSSKLAFVTDGTLISWIAAGEVDKINTIMIDEAHERSLNIDIIIGMLTRLLPRRPRLRLIIASATISADAFINHFNRFLPRRKDAAGNVLPNCRLMEFEGKSFKVTPHFRRPDQRPLDYFRHPLQTAPDGAQRWEGRHRDPPELPGCVAEAAAELLRAMYDPAPDGGFIRDHAGRRIDLTERRGDILAFLQGEAPIQNCRQQLEKLCAEPLAPGVKLRVLPLYTTLKQSDQDEALKEREQPHGVLRRRLLELLAEAVAGRPPRGDVAAVLNNAGQIHNLCAELERRIAAPTVEHDGVEAPNPLATLRGRVRFFPWFTADTARQLFESSPARAEMTIPPAEPGVLRVAITTSRRRPELPDAFSTIVELPPEERRVVISTNVAETSLTIHGILHVVDSGLLNQNKWDRETQTSGVSPVLQSRAGCKQRWGRAGRLQAGDAWLLYTEDQFGKEKGEDDHDPRRCFDFYSRPEITRSPMEQVLLAAKKAGVQSLDPADFPWLDAPDQLELARSSRRLLQSGALDADGDLTERGVELGGMRSDPRIGALLIEADRFVCAVEMATVMAVAARGLKGLLAFDRLWDDQTLQENRRRQSLAVLGCPDDLDAALRLAAGWDAARAAGEAFVALSLLMAGEDALSRAFDAAPAGPRGDDLRRTISALRRESDDARAADLLDALLRTADPARRRELRDAAQASGRALRDYQRLQPVGDAVRSSPAFAALWDQACAAPALAPLTLRQNLPPDEHRDAIERLTEALPLLRAAHARGDSALRTCADDLARRLGDRLHQHRPSLTLLSLLARAPDPALGPAAAAEALRQLPRNERLAAEDALRNAPDAAARAWARSNGLRPEALAEVMDARAELLEPLEAHKKGAESRPLDLGRTHRLRALLAHGLPDNLFLRAPDGSFRAADAQQAPLDVEIAADSMCAGADVDSFVCLERRAGPALEGRPRKLFASFIVRIPPDWPPALSRAMTAAGLARFMADRCPSDPFAAPRLLASLAFPGGSSCRAKVLHALGHNRWAAEILAVDAPPPAVLVRARRASDEDRLPPAEEVLRSARPAPRDLGLSRRQLAVKADAAVEESTGQIASAEWERLYDADEPETDPSPLPAPLPSPSARTAAVLTAPGALQPGQLLPAEIVGVSASGPPVLELRSPTAAQGFQDISNALTPAHIGREFELSVVRLERRLLDAGSVLIAREPASGCEIALGPRDLSFSSCGEVPRIVAQRLPPGSTFKARLVQLDPEAGRLRMTTHHAFARLFPDPAAAAGKRAVEVLAPAGSARFCRILLPDESLEPAFVHVAMLDAELTAGADPGARIDVHLSFSNRTREAWPDGVEPPDELRFRDDHDQDSLLLSGPATPDRLLNWLRQTGDDRRARAALYSLYERSLQLAAMDEAEYARWSACVGRPLHARVLACKAPGLSLSVPGLHAAPLWLPREEFSWRIDERHSDLAPGAEIDVVGLEVDLARRQITASRRRLAPNPYRDRRPGSAAAGLVFHRDPAGFEVSLDGLRGWCSATNALRLPQEGPAPQVGQPFDAVVSAVDPDAGKIILSRWPIVQPLLRRMAAGVVLRALVADFVLKNGEAVGASVLLADDLRAFLPASEVTWARGRVDPRHVLALGQSVDVVLLPLVDGGRLDNLRVSRKRAWSAEFVLAGRPGLFFGRDAANIENIRGELKALGPMGVDTLNRADAGSLLLIGADDPRGFEAFASRLRALAASTRCTLSRQGSLHQGPFALADLALPRPEAPGLLRRVLAGLARLLRRVLLRR